MRCMYCAEEIQDAAVVCRYCGAVKDGGAWRSPQLAAAQRAAAAPPPKKASLGAFTMKSTGALLLVSAAIDLAQVGSPVPLFGDVREGAVAALYHLLYAGLFAAVGVALLWPRPWGLRVVLGGIGFYVLERTLYAFDTSAREAELARALKGHEEVAQLLPATSILGIGTLTTLLMVASLGGFGLWVYFKRAYFEGEPPPPREPGAGPPPRRVLP